MEKFLYKFTYIDEESYNITTELSNEEDFKDWVWLYYTFSNVNEKEIDNLIKRDSEQIKKYKKIKYSDNDIWEYLG